MKVVGMRNYHFVIIYDSTFVQRIGLQLHTETKEVSW